MKNYYEILQVSPHASSEIIRAVWTALMKQHHPDTGGNSQQAKRINEAYSVLKDPEKRAAHDQQLTAQRKQEKQEFRPPVNWAHGNAAEWLRQQGRRIADEVIDEVLAEHATDPLLNAFAEIFRNPYHRRPQ